LNLCQKLLLIILPEAERNRNEKEANIKGVFSQLTMVVYWPRLTTHTKSGGSIKAGVSEKLNIKESQIRP